MNAPKRASVSATSLPSLHEVAEQLAATGAARLDVANENAMTPNDWLEAVGTTGDELDQHVIEGFDGDAT